MLSSSSLLDSDFKDDFRFSLLCSALEHVDNASDYLAFLMPTLISRLTMAPKQTRKTNEFSSDCEATYHTASVEPSEEIRSTLTIILNLVLKRVSEDEKLALMDDVVLIGSKTLADAFAPVRKVVVLMGPVIFTNFHAGILSFYRGDCALSWHGLTR